MCNVLVSYVLHFALSDGWHWHEKDQACLLLRYNGLNWAWCIIRFLNSLRQANNMKHFFAKKIPDFSSREIICTNFCRDVGCSAISDSLQLHRLYILLTCRTHSPMCYFFFLSFLFTCFSFYMWSTTTFKITRPDHWKNLNRLLPGLLCAHDRPLKRTRKTSFLTNDPDGSGWANH
jgi:hypothetical protein